ncbi:MAG: biotin transport system substrate-specific component [Thermococcaceae archaeon]|mgnify:CR=1 FL=1|jgi:biotin transport system substrate-specific component|nr:MULTISPECIES: biotin transporter BioY [Thermococcus]MDK2783599.1 biotin transport system substrate-specific component [Thermococcaceae archaeon]MCA6214706.1 biotin transporter BioY [Thermococcus bergensis]MDK2853560.1 biotin transport system substrate-specific component [Thermococcaceae archaeon]MDK2983195.1 biotin transport system substrate-specific component [Thermococcaceae archaeon]MDN5319898.1 biotin transport system substrate-specific component [Thermococcaceae archaeon]
MEAREITYAALFAALTAVGAQIAIPLGTVPITLQVLFVLLSGLILGAKLGFLSQIVYLFMGAIGLPVFANFSGGLAYIYGPTGGYLISFPLAAFLAGLVSEKRKRITDYAVGSAIGILVIYLLGWLRLGLFMGGDFEKAFMVGVVPFIPIDAVKGAIAVVIADRIHKSIKI